jgi:hypothetical protein
MILAERQPSLDQGQTTCASDGWSWKRQKSWGPWTGERFLLRQTPWTEVVVTCDWAMKTGKYPNRREASAVTVNLLCCAVPCCCRLRGVVFIWPSNLEYVYFPFPTQKRPPDFCSVWCNTNVSCQSCQRTAPNPTNCGSAIMSCPPNDLRVTRRWETLRLETIPVPATSGQWGFLQNSGPMSSINNFFLHVYIQEAYSREGWNYV